MAETSFRLDAFAIKQLGFLVAFPPPDIAVTIQGSTGFVRVANLLSFFFIQSLFFIVFLTFFTYVYVGVLKFPLYLEYNTLARPRQAARSFFVRS